MERNQPKVLCIGHRGAAGHRPENSLASIQTAIDMNADVIEIDVHLVENQLVVFHDHRLERLTGQSGLMSRLTFNELRGLRSLGEPIPTLQEVVDLIDRRAVLNIELKGQNCHSAMSAMYRLMRRQGWEEQQILVSSFDHVQLHLLKQAEPRVRIGMLIECQPHNLARMAEELDAYSIHICKDFLTPAFLDDAHRRGFQVYCYTVNFEDEITDLIQLGVDGIISDYPDRVHNLLQHQLSSLAS